MQQDEPGLVGLAATTIAAHATTYFAMELLAASLLNYQDLFARPGFVCWTSASSRLCCKRCSSRWCSSPG